jgi:rhamnose utilization protein RhaD (predicted bifunctional aldolase and dehydrogenase)
VISSESDPDLPTAQNRNSVAKQLLRLSHELGRPEHRLAILGEGNVSARVNDEAFLIKASGSNLQTLKRRELVEVRFENVLPLLDGTSDDKRTQDALLAARTSRNGPIPSIETTFHAWLLRQDQVAFVGHTHPIEVNKILCSNRAVDFADHRVFPDEVVCCGPKSLLIDYVDPGTVLATAIRDAWLRFVAANGYSPRVILIKNHGLITVGARPESILTATLMAVKAAEIFVGAAAVGGPVFMPENEVQRIHSRTDEEVRRKRLSLQ